MKKLFLVLLALLLAGCRSGQENIPLAAVPLPTQPTNSLEEIYGDELEDLIGTVGEKYGATGVQVAILEKGVVAASFGWGWATKDVSPMTKDHKIRIASLSKIALGVATQLLRQEGAVELDTDIGAYWGIDLQISTTLREILTHTSALRDFNINNSREYAPVKARLEKGGFSNATPGAMETWHYNNYAFGVLGMTLELAAGETVDDILSPLYEKMDIDAAFVGAQLKNKELIATLYRSDGAVARTAQKQQTMTRDLTPGATGTYFAGGMLCSAEDFAKLLSLLANDGIYDGQRLLTKESVASMERLMESPTPGGSYQAMPMRLWENLYGRDRIYFHTGSAYGVYNCASYDPKTGDGVVVLTTGARGSKDKYGIYKICSELSAYIYDLLNEN